MASHTDCLMLAERSYDVQWDQVRVEKVYRLIQHAALGYLPTLVELALRQNWAPGYGAASFARLCGDVRAGWHAFCAEPLEWGFTLSEPQVTTALVHFLSLKVDGAAEKNRCAALVRALYRAAGVTDERQRLDPSKARNGSLSVEAEHRIGRKPGSKRVDIAIKWEEDGAERPRLILIECKFNHHVTRGQLPAYREYAQRQTGERGHELFVIVDRLSGRTAAAIRRNRDWIPLTWRALIRRLEQEGVESRSMDGTDDFARLRRTIWEMANKHSF